MRYFSIHKRIKDKVFGFVKHNEYKIGIIFCILGTYIAGISAGIKIGKTLFQPIACPVSLEEAVKEARKSSTSLYTRDLVIVPLRDGSLIVKDRKKDNNGSSRK